MSSPCGGWEPGAQPSATVSPLADSRPPTPRGHRPACAQWLGSRGTCLAESARGPYGRRSPPEPGPAHCTAPLLPPLGSRLPGSPAWLPIWKPSVGVSSGPPSVVGNLLLDPRLHVALPEQHRPVPEIEPRDVEAQDVARADMQPLRHLGGS